ncbi:MAG: hypothetical protein LBU27_05410 [Candidatus Peribacteria bacterium]|jgi:hypothetical protein|nr:hypothetical protein [Candidatus Peribacteria bacterium]
MHHYYFDGVVFPGQKSKFSFRDVALSSQRLDEQHLCFVSGHLHQSFTYKNYLCTGSVRATSPLEENQLKGVRKWSGAQWSFYEMGVNAYFAMESAAGLFPSPLTSDEVIAHYEQLKIKLKENLLSLPVEYHFLLALDLKTVVLSLRVEELKYQQMDSFVLPELQTQLADIKLKRQQVRVEDLLEKLQKPDSALLKSGFSGWIDLLKAFLRKQYPESYQEYEKLLQELELV